MPIQSFQAFVVPFGELEPNDKFIIMDSVLLSVAETIPNMTPIIGIRGHGEHDWHPCFWSEAVAGNPGTPTTSWAVPNSYPVMRVR